MRLVFSEVADPVRAELDRYGITDLVGADAYYPSLPDVLTAYRGQAGPPAAGPSPALTTGQH